MNANVTWANATFTYEFLLANGQILKGATLGIDVGPEKAQPQFKGSQIRCDLKNVFKLTTTDRRLSPKIFWADDIFGSDGDARLLLDSREGVPRDVALIKIHENEAWIARCEPTLDGRLAITIANEKNKVLLLGIGDLIEVDFEPMRSELPPKKGHQLVATLHESYQWKSANPASCAHCAGSVRQTSPSTTPDYSAPDGGTCFAAGTPVMLAGSITKPIEGLRLDDLVLARDEETGRVGTRRIKHVWMHNVESTLLMRLKNGEQIETTPRHQFAVAGMGFRDASELTTENELITYNGVPIKVMRTRQCARRTVVYNLEVEEFHTYFVGKAGAWVHNMRKTRIRP